MKRVADVLDPRGYEAGVPHAEFRALRSRSPVVALTGPEGEPVWAVLGHPEIVAVSKDPATFSSAHRGTQLSDPTPQQLPLIRAMMLNLDPPVHGQFRSLVRAGFTPARIHAMEAKVHELAVRVLDAALAHESFDFVREVAAELPLLVLAELLGVPEQDRSLLFGWSNRVVGFDDPELAATPDDALAAATEMYVYAQTLAHQRRSDPRDDLISMLVHAELGGRRLRDEEFNGLFVQIAVAGNETSRSLIAGGMHELLLRPAAIGALRENPSRVECAVEEMLRWVCPVLHFRRTAMRPCRLGSVEIEEGEKVVLFFCAANRDQRVFERPEEFDIERRPNPHLAFGIGEHVCLGAALARMEARLLFEELFRRQVELELVESPRRLRSNQINGLKEMHVVVRR